MYRLNSFDIVIIIVYFLAMAGIGFYFSKKIRNSEDFFIAGRSLGVFPIIATVCASIIGGGALIGRGGVIYSRGFVAIWAAVPYFVGMLGFGLIAKRINTVGKKFNISSLSELVGKRFGVSTKFLFSALIAYTMMATVGSQISASATIMSIIGKQSGISYELGAIIAALIFILYTSVSGLFGVVYTDVAQFIVLIVSVYIIVPIVSLFRIGGISSMVSKIPSEMLNLTPDATITGYFFTTLLFSFAGAEMWQRAFASRDGKVAKKGILNGTLAYGITIVITLVLGLSAYILLPNLIQDYGTVDAAIPALVISCLPIGITGLAIAGLLAVMMSSADTYLLVSAQTILEDFIKHFKPNLSTKKELLATRILTLFLGVSALVIALYIKGAYNALMFAWTFYAASIGFPAFAALLWEKATKAGIISSVLAGFSVSLFWKIAGSPFGIADALAGCIICVVTLISVSLCTYEKGKYPLLK